MALGLLLLMMGAVVAAAAEPAANLLIIQNAAVIDGTGEAPRRGMTLVIQGERIIKVGPTPTVHAPANARVIDAAGKYAIPGLWDMHVHLFSTKSSAIPALVANGVTGIRDVGGLLRELEEWRVRIDSGAMIGPRIVRAGPMINGRQFGVHQIAVSTGAEARVAVRTLQASGVDFIKVHRALSRDAYFAVVDESRKLGLPVVGHVPTTASPREASDAGQASIEHVGTLFEGTFAAENPGSSFLTALAQFPEGSAATLFAVFAQNGTAVTPTLVSHRMMTQFDRAKADERDKYVSRSARKLTSDVLTRDRQHFTPEFYERVTKQFEVALPLVRQMQEAGVRLLAGTDLGPAGSYPGFDLHEELALLVEAGLTPMQALQTATRNAAEFLHLSDSGVIAEGKRADLVLLDADPLADIRNTRQIHCVVLRGQLLQRPALDGLLRETERKAAVE